MPAGITGLNTYETHECFLLSHQITLSQSIRAGCISLFRFLVAHATPANANIIIYGTIPLLDNIKNNSQHWHNIIYNWVCYIVKSHHTTYITCLISNDSDYVFEAIQKIPKNKVDWFEVLDQSADQQLITSAIFKTATVDALLWYKDNLDVDVPMCLLPPEARVAVIQKVATWYNQFWHCGDFQNIKACDQIFQRLGIDFSRQRWLNIALSNHNPQLLEYLIIKHNIKLPKTFPICDYNHLKLIYQHKISKKFNQIMAMLFAIMIILVAPHFLGFAVGPVPSQPYIDSSPRSVLLYGRPELNKI